MSPNLNRKTLGVNYTARGEAEVLVWAPYAHHVALVLHHKPVRIPMEKDAHGYWSCITHYLQPGSLYWFELDHAHQLPDPASLSQPDDVHGPSQVVNLHTTLWTDQQWKNIPLEDYIFYELHTGTFSKQGDFAGIEKKIQYLKDLGITAIEIMPVAQFPGTRNWGYDGVFPWSVHASYGGVEGLQHLVNVCHENGLAVVLDVVYNHMGPEGNYLRSFGPYFTDKYKTPWGDAINFDDAGCDSVRHFFIENALMWFRDFHIDALRLDAVHAIKDFSPKHILKEIREYTDALMRATGRTHYLIVECDLNDRRFIDPLEKNGYGMSAQWNDEFHHALRVASGGQRVGYYTDFDGVLHLAKSYRDGYVYDGVFSHHRNKTFGTKTDGLDGKQFIVFSQNHDHIGNRMLGERTGSLVSFEMLKLLAGAVIFSPYLPLLFMGEEYGETNPFLYFISHTDEELIASVQQGRKREFASFHLDGEAPDPQSEETFGHSKLQWELIREKKHATLLSYYREILSLRKKIKPLRTTDRSNITMKVYEPEQIIALLRWKNDDVAMILLNFNRQPQTIPTPFTEHAWHRLLNSAAPLWGGLKEIPEYVSGQKIELQPESICLFTNYDV